MTGSAPFAVFFLPVEPFAIFNTPIRDTLDETVQLYHAEVFRIPRVRPN